MINEQYKLWCEKATIDPDLVAELKAIEGNDEAISDAFYKDLEFGTGGLRGVIGAGTNRMIVYTVGKATQGLAAYVNSVTKNGKVAIAYDSRIKSDVFARDAAAILAANGIKVYIYKELMPTPMLSFAVRYLGCDAGIVVTASHNPSKYNGYKAYGNDGCQLGLEAADYVLSIMNSVDIFDGVKRVDFDAALNEGKIEYIGEHVFSGCQALKSVTLPKTVTSIAGGAFDSCVSFAEVNYEGNEEDWQKIDINESWNKYLLSAKINYNYPMPDPIVLPDEVEGEASSSNAEDGENGSGSAVIIAVASVAAVGAAAGGTIFFIKKKKA